MTLADGRLWTGGWVLGTHGQVDLQIPLLCIGITGLCIRQREEKRRRAIVQLEHDIKRQLQNVIINTFRRRHAVRAAGTCQSDETRHCQQFKDVTPEDDALHPDSTRL